MWTPLIVGDFIFDEGRLEVPEHFGDVGGTQRIAQHDFPGGIRTHKALGYFPSALHWKATCSSDDAVTRIEALKRLVFAGNEVKLEWGQRSWYGRLTRISPTARNDFLYDFDIEFWPRVDLGAPGLPYPSFAAVAAIIQLHILFLQNIIQNGLTWGEGFAIIANLLGPQVGLLASTIDGALLIASGAVANISQANQQQIFQQSLAALATVQPYLNSSDPTLSSPANDATAHIQAILNLTNAGQPPLATIQTINPNLVVLAAQYYGDGTAWRLIATANDLNDPQPIGNFNLVIPQQPS